MGYTKRHTERVMIDSIEESDTYYACHTAQGTGFQISKSRLVEGQRPHVGREYDLELYLGSSIAGLKNLAGTYIMERKSDEEFEADRLRFVAETKERHYKQWEEHHEEWQARQDALPDWLQERLQRFHQNGGDKFTKEDWPYELVVAELAAMYYLSNGAETDEITQYASVNGTSGNQHGIAKLIADIHTVRPEDDAMVPGGLAPLTGDPYYKGKGVTTP